jgi:ribosomal protein S27AE
MAIDKNIKLPQKFLEQYRKNIGSRISASIALFTTAGVLCAAIDFSETRYPVMGVVMIMVVGFVLSCLVAGLHRILFRKSWSGTITNIDAGMKYRADFNQHGKPSLKLLVILTIDCGGKKPKTLELFPDSDLHGVESENKFYTEAPYKVGDTVVFLRGMKYPLRYSVETEDMFDLHFVCPYCGDINKAERDTCYHCGKFVVK